MQNERKDIFIVALAFVVCAAIAFGFTQQPVPQAINFGAPNFRQDRTILPAEDSMWELGTTSREWLNVFTDQLCLAGDCRTAWPASGSGVWPFTPATNFATSTQSTTTPAWFRGSRFSLFASSTAVLDYASTTALSATTLYGALVGNASTATNLAGNGANCSAGNFPLGVDASGAAESCTDAWTEAENTAAAYVPGSRTITVAGTSQQLTSSAGAQDLSSNRTWTLSLPNHVVFPASLFAPSASTTNATTTNFSIGGLLTFDGVTGNSWDDFCTTITGSAALCDGDDATGAGGGVWPFTPSTNFNVAVQSTSTPIFDSAGFHASSTSQFVNLNIWNQLTLKATTSTMLWANAAGDVVATTTIGNNFLTNNGAFTATVGFGLSGGGTVPLGGTLTINGVNAAANDVTRGTASFTGTDFNDNGSALISIDYANGQEATATLDGFLAKGDWRTFNNKVATATVPTSGQLAVWSTAFPATLYSIATTSPALSSAFSYSGTLGALVGGAAGTLSSVQTPAFSFPAGAQTATTTTATTTVALGTAWFAETWSGIECWSGSGTVGYRLTDGTNAMNFLQATTTVSRFALSSNNTFVASEKRFVEIGPMTASYLSCTINKTI